ncbi:hypothetical protein OAQ99_04880 [Candidatus Kapabacteria bacterium]|nr:hypothetical protein [Candidatus Kapabacteria bacterium]
MFVNLYNLLSENKSDNLILKELAIDVRKFNNLKAYLFNFILESLSLFHTEAGVKNQIYSLLKSIDILFNKSLFELVIMPLKKARKLAVEYYDLRLLHEIIIWELRILLSPKYNGQLKKTVEEVLNEEKDLILDLEKIREYREFRYVSSVNTPIEKPLSNNLMVNLEYYRTLYFVNLKNNNLQSAYESISKEITLFEKYENIDKDRVILSKYINSLGDQILIELLLKENILDTLNKLFLLVEFKNNPKVLTNHIRLRSKFYYYFGVLESTDQDYGEDTAELVSHLMKTKIYNNFNNQFKLSIIYSLSKYLIKSNEFRKAILITNEVKSTKEESLYKAHFLAIKIICHYNLGNLDLVDSLTRILKKENTKSMEILRLLKYFYPRINENTDKQIITDFLIPLNYLENLNE